MKLIVTIPDKLSLETLNKLFSHLLEVDRDLKESEEHIYIEVSN